MLTRIVYAMLASPLPLQLNVHMRWWSGPGRTKLLEARITRFFQQRIPELYCPKISHADSVPRFYFVIELSDTMAATAPPDARSRPARLG